ncbi:MAG: PEP-CTERM sorting domain-containing protein [Phycisphaerales bacterium]
MVSMRIASATAGALVVAGAANAELVTINTTYINDTASTKTFDVVQSVYLAGPIYDAVMSGSITATVHDLNGNGAWFTSVGGGDVYQAIVDEESVRSLFNNVSMYAHGPFQAGSPRTEVFGGEAVPKGYVSSQMGLRLNFTLTAGDSVTFSTVFQVIGSPVPAPGAMALLGVAGLAGTRRRRR